MHDDGRLEYILLMFSYRYVVHYSASQQVINAMFSAETGRGRARLTHNANSTYEFPSYLQTAQGRARR